MQATTRSRRIAAWTGIAFACANALAFAQVTRPTGTTAPASSSGAPTPAPAAAQVPQAMPAMAIDDDGRPVVDLDTMTVVSGTLPGPGLWQVRKGDHVLWILGTQGPLPKRMEWDATEVEAVAARSQAFLESPTVGLEKEVGFFRGLTMLPTALKARRDPEGRTLAEVVGPADHARWLALKARYIGGNDGIEQWRPVFAALELYDEAVEKSGMTFNAGITKRIERAAKKGGAAVVPVKVTIPVDDPRAALKEFAKVPLDDLDCFRKTLARIEGDLGNMAARANAWAVGDLDSLRALPYENQFVACNAAFTGAALAKRYGMHDLPQRIESAWIGAAENALAKNASTIAMLPIQQLLRDDGYLAKLQARGYVVVAPGAGDDAATEPPTPAPATPGAAIAPATPTR